MKSNEYIYFVTLYKYRNLTLTQNQVVNLLTQINLVCY